MKKLLFLALILTLPLAAEECSVGMVWGVTGDSLILVDGLKVHVPNLQQSFVNGRSESVGFESVKFPFTATLLRTVNQTGDDEATDSDLEKMPGVVTVRVRIDQQFEIKDGRAVKKLY